MIKEIITSEGKFIQLKPVGTRIKIKKNTPFYDLYSNNLFGYCGSDDDTFTFKTPQLFKGEIYAIIQADATNVLFSKTPNGDYGYSYEPFGDSTERAEVIVKYSDIDFVGG